MGSEIIAAIIGVIAGFFASRENIKDNLDSKSGWRKELFDVASKDIIKLDDVYRVKAALRLSKHSTVSMRAYSFKFMTNVIYNICECYINKYEQVYDQSDLEECNNESCELKKNERIIKEFEEREILRICTRYLLKYHWDYNSTKSFFNGVLKDVRLAKYDSIGKETCEQIIKYGGEIKYE